MAAGPDRSNPTRVLAQTLWGEARGEGERGMRAVGGVPSGLGAATGVPIPGNKPTRL